MPPPSAKQLEARLGFNFQLGISRDPRAKRTPATFQLLQRVDEISTRYISYGITRIRKSEGIKRRTNTSWLLGPFDDNDPHGFTEYPKDLVFSDPIDRVTITERFRDFVEQKVLRYHSNHFKNLPTAHDPPDSDCRTNSGESEAEEDTREDAGEDERDTPSDYRPSRSRRTQILDGAPRSGIRNKKMSTYAAPTAPMLPGPSSMGQTESKLNSANLAFNRAAPSKYRKHYRTSKDDRGDRSKPTSDSGLVSDILFDVNPDSPARRSSEFIPFWQQEESIQVESRSASKRVCSADTEAETGRKKKKHTEELPQSAHRSRSGLGGPSLDLAFPSQLAVGRSPPRGSDDSPSQTNLSSTKEHYRPYLQPSVADEPEESILYEDTVMSLLTPSSPTGRTIAAAYVNPGMNVNKDKNHEEHSQLTVQDLATQQSQLTLAALEAASRASSSLRSVGIECIGHDTRTTVHNTLPVAAPPPASYDESRQTAVSDTFPPPTTAPMTTTINAKSTTNLTTDESQSACKMQSTRNVAMFAKILRDGQPEPEDFYRIAFQTLVSSDDFFENLREELNLSADDTIVRAVVKRVSELEVLGLPRRWTDFTMNERRRMNIGWETLLKGLEKVYKRDGEGAEMEMEVEVRLSTR